MTPLGLTGRLAGAAARRPWLFLAGWMAALAAAGFFATGLGSVIDDGGGLGVPTESEHADAVIAEHFPDQSPPTEFLIVESDSVDVDNVGFRALISGLEADLDAIDSVDTVVSPLSGASGLVSADGSVALVSFTLSPEVEEVDPIEPVIDMVSAHETAGYRLTLFGDASIGAEMDRLAEETLVRGEAIGLGIALVIMVVVFGAMVAAGIPIILSIAAIVVAVALTTLAGAVFSISSVVLNMITMIGLAVGVDYSLFILHRYREERGTGLSVVDAVARAGDSAGRAVLFSGITVVVALGGLLVIPEATIRGVGIGAICSVIGAIVVALTLLPAILGLLGDRVEKGSLPARKRSAGRLWDRIAARVMRRPLVSALAAGGLLLAMAAPYTTIALGSNFIDSMPEESSAAHGLAVMNEHFNTGSTTTSVVVEAENVASEQVASSVEALMSSAQASGYYAQARLETSADRTVAVVDLSDLTDPSTEEGGMAVETLRTGLIPDAFDGTGVLVSVTGPAASTQDYVEVIDSSFPVVLALVLGVSFLLLLVAFRSVVVPLKAIAMNLLSVGAAYGMLVLVFQHGVGADLLGFETSDVIEAWIPVFLFTVLFGLSMDYHIFLLSRIKEHHDTHGDNEASVAFGLRSTGALITGAALIMVAVFGGFATGDLAVLQQLGFGLALAVILDATVVRSVLVPATMALLGERNWYLPAWLEWLPRIEIEGAPDRHRPAELAATSGGEAR